MWSFFFSLGRNKVDIFLHIYTEIDFSMVSRGHGGGCGGRWSVARSMARSVARTGFISCRGRGNPGSGLADSRASNNKVLL